MTGAGRRPPPATAVAASGTQSAPPTFAPPSWLTRREARDVWKRVVPELARFNIMTEIFRDVIGRYCDAFADWIKLNRQIQRQGTTTLVQMTNSKAKMRRINPAIRVRESLEKSLIDLEDRFGISPLARYRIVAHQAANPGQRDLFRDQPPTAGEADAESLLPQHRASPIGALLQ